MINQTETLVKTFSLLAGVGLVIVFALSIGLIIQVIRKKPLKVWVVGLIFVGIFTLISYAISFLNIFQLYNLTSK